MLNSRKKNGVIYFEKKIIFNKKTIFNKKKRIFLMEPEQQRRRELPPISFLEQQPIEILVEIFLKSDAHPKTLLNLLTSSPVLSYMLSSRELWKGYFIKYFRVYYNLFGQQLPGFAKNWFIAFWYIWTLEITFTKAAFWKNFESQETNIRYFYNNIIIKWIRDPTYKVVEPLKIESDWNSTGIVNQQTLVFKIADHNYNPFDTIKIYSRRRGGLNESKLEITLSTRNTSTQSYGDNYNEKWYDLPISLQLDRRTPILDDLFQMVNPLLGPVNNDKGTPEFLENTALGVFYTSENWTLGTPKGIDVNEPRFFFDFRGVKPNTDISNVLKMADFTFSPQSKILRGFQRFKISKNDSQNISILIMYLHLKIRLPIQLYFFWGVYELYNEDIIQNSLVQNTTTQEELDRIVEVGKRSLTAQKIKWWSGIELEIAELDEVLNLFATLEFEEAMANLERYMKSRFIAPPRNEDKTQYTIDCKVCNINGATLKCGQCQNAYYCSEKCQKQDWEEHDHQKECK